MATPPKSVILSSFCHFVILCNPAFSYRILRKINLNKILVQYIQKNKKY